MLKNRIVYLLALAGLFLFYIFCNSYVPIYALVLLLSLTVLSIVFAFFASRKISVSIKTSSVDMKKRRAEFCVEVKNGSVVPVPTITFDVIFRDMTETERIHRRVRATAAMFETKEIFLSLDAPNAAYIEATLRKIRVCDGFGLVSFPIKRTDESAHALIMPKHQPIPREYGKLTSAINDSDIYSDTRKGDDRSQVFEVREYRDGDDIRNVHWWLSSKLDSLMVKEFSLPLDERCDVLLENAIEQGISPLDKKIRTDKLLAEFTQLAVWLINEERIFTAYYYSSEYESLSVCDVTKYEDISVLLKGVLSQPSYSTPMTAYNAYRELHSDSAVYYIFDSSINGAQRPPQQDNIYVIDISTEEKR